MGTETDTTAPSPAYTVVGIGASAGGLTALRELLEGMSSEAPVALFVVQHLDPSQHSQLPEILARSTDLRVVRAEDGASIEEHTVYVCPPGVELGVDEDLRLRLTPIDRDRRPPRPIDHLFSSLARHLGPRVAGIVLTGTGSDGTIGLRRIKQAGGLSIAQDPDTAEYRAMPASAIELGATNQILTISQMPAVLERFAELPTDLLEPTVSDAREVEPRTEPDDEALAQLSSLLAQTTQFTLDNCKRSTVRRRVVRRMALAGFEDFDRYMNTVSDDPREQQAIIDDLFIGVTEFFRDPETFEALRNEVIDPLVEQAAPATTLRVWVAGCASGEEAYSLAMLFIEALDKVPQKKLDLQIFATDIDPEAIEIARRGVFPPSIAEQVDEARLQRFFIAEHGAYRVRPQLRDHLSFAVHDLTEDPPFARMDLVSCRNVLIYLRPAAQQRVFELLHFALRDEGVLCLGASGAIARGKQLFKPLSERWKLYTKVPNNHRTSGLTLSAREPFRIPSSTSPSHRAPYPRRPGHTEMTDVQRALLDARVPPSLVVGAHGEILYSHGPLDPYLQFPQGAPRMELMSVLRPELTARVRSAVSRCRREAQTTKVTARPDADSTDRVEITVSPATQLGEGQLIATFEILAQADQAPVERLPPQDRPLVDQLERELQTTRQDLRNTVADLETANEELRAMHEESTAMNEELQSANEELEASSEELRSLNEELGTVNAELHHKVEHVEQINNDLSNFIASTQIATLFLDEQLHIKRVTPSACQLLRLSETVQGSYVGDIARELLQEGLVADAQVLLDRLEPREREIKLSDGRWVVRRVLPYLTDNRRIEGVVVTFIEITQLKQTTERLSAREHQQTVIAKLGLHALEEPDLEILLDQIVREVQQTLDTDMCKILELRPDQDELLLRAGVGWREGLVGRATVDTGRESQAGFTLRSSQPVIVDDLSREKRFSGPPLLHDHDVTSGISCTIRDGDGIYGIIGAHTRDRRKFTTEDTVFLQAIAAVIAAAIARHYSKTQLKLETDIAKTIASSGAIDDLFYQVHAKFDELLDVPVGELWWKESEEDVLTCRLESVQGSPLDEDCLYNFCRGEFRPGEGLIGRVFESSKPEWLTRLDAPSQFVRLDAAEQLGLQSGLAVPVIVADTVCGVMAFFSTEPLVPDAAFLQGLESTGRAIGEFVRRQRVEAAWRREEHRYAQIFEQVGVALWEEDFTQVKEAIDQMRASGIDDLEAHFKEHPEVVDELIAKVDIVDVNPETVRLFGACDKAQMLESLSQIALPETRRAFIAQFLALARGDTFLAADTRVQRLDGRPLDVTFTVRFPPSERELDRVLVSLMDITRLKRAEAQLREASQQKDNYLAMLGHELRNPLAAVRTAAETLHLLDGDNPKITRIQGILDRQTAHMAKLLDGLLDVSRIVRGKIALERDRVALDQLCRRVLDDRQHAIEERDLTLHTALPDEPIWIDADPVRLTQVVDNLVSNAVKYTEAPGQISVGLRAENDQAVLEVADTGVGIAAELLPHVFEPFRQAQQSLDRTAGGLGLGLALVERLVELHGGTVEAYSDGHGHGARFVVRLPRATSDEAKPRKRE
ncbi:GAF domain-containing protein [Persicimonas caeni]|uniref:GAF domain-containing protein n=1 Tax=Persicimonas caeni TaxID=2292766 RepID=A0A4Y6PNF9_PERCE|nr:chemotaxis protein CheB [Persicimonas caeni]QDG49846.1 GAF domain-containing protein [Persicimonas caeni]QED31067.1 GAF domain-containing protein [Persicimonas caeni]